nr:extracellular solute-binding protein [Bradyrhizobium sp. CIR48]
MFLITTAAGALAGTAGSAFSRGAAPIKLRVQYAYPRAYDLFMKDIADKFTAIRPDVHVEFLPAATDYIDLAQKMLRAAIASGMPDVTIGGMNTVDMLAERKLIMPLKPLIASEKDWESLGYSPSILSLGSVGGEPYCMPFTIAIKSIYYNLDLVKRAGGDPDNLPKSWDEVIALQRRIQGLGNSVSGLYADYYFDNNFTFQSLIQTQGGAMVASNGHVAFGSKEGLQALKWLRGFGEAGMIDMTAQQSYQAFAGGTIGILVASSSNIIRLQKESGGRFPIKVVAFPRASNGKVPGGGASVMLHAQESDKLKAAWDFAKFVTGPVGSTIMVHQDGYLPGNNLVINDPRYLKSFYEQNPAQRAMVEQLPLLTKWHNWSGENSLKIIDVIRDHMQQVVTLKKAPEETIAKMVSDVEALRKL